jgi:hypothetical protein
MFGIKIKGKFLHLKQGRLSAKLSNPLYLGDNMDVIPGSLLLNTEVPNDDWNAVLLENVDDLQVKRAFLKNEYCEIWFNGSILFLGTLEVIRATDKVFVVRAGLNTLSILKDINLDDMDFGTLNITSLDQSVYMQTLLNPLAHPYIFHPVWNPGFNDVTAPIFEDNEFQNLYKFSGTALLGDIVQQNSSVITPFFRLEHVLKTVFSNVNYSLNNGFQAKRELKLITLYNASSIHTRQGYFNSTSLSLNRFLPNKKASEFLKNIARNFGLGLFYNIFDKQVDLLPFDDVWNAQKVHDWTKMAVHGHEREQSTNSPSSIKYKKNEKSLVPELDTLTRYPLSTLDFASSPNGLYVDYPNGLALYWKNINNNDIHSAVVKVVLEDGFYQTQNDSKAFENPITPLSTKGDFGGLSYAPCLNQKGFYSDETKIAFEPHLMMYRGFRRTNPNNDRNQIYPFAASENELAYGEEIKCGWDWSNNPPPATMWPALPIEYTLNIKGEKGIYNKFLKRNMTFLSQNDGVKKRFTLTLNALREFSFKDKITVHNQQYLVKEIDLEFEASNDYINCEASLLSVI